MSTSHRQSIFAVIACAIALFGTSSAGADQRDDRHPSRNRPVDVTFTKWGTGGTLLTGIAGGDVPGTFVGEVVHRVPSVNVLVNPNPDPSAAGNPLLNGIVKLEALYQVNADFLRQSFTALIRGGQNQVTGKARFDGVILAGWRSGARVEVTYQRYFALDQHCIDAGAPVTATCFVGSIHIEADPKE
jgi:hypothetical protein